MRSFWVPKESLFDPESALDANYSEFYDRDVEVVLKSDYNRLNDAYNALLDLEDSFNG